MTFDILGRRWGILICYEGVYPYLHDDWSQLAALKAAGADTFVWSVGAVVPIAHYGSWTAVKYNVSMVISSDESFVTGTNSAAIVGSDGKVPAQQDVPLQPPKYYTKGGLHVRLATLQ